MKKLPISLSVVINGTNPTSILNGLEAICDSLHKLVMPRKGETFIDKKFDTPYWKVKIIDSVRFLDKQ